MAGPEVPGLHFHRCVHLRDGDKGEWPRRPCPRHPLSWSLLDGVWWVCPSHVHARTRGRPSSTEDSAQRGSAWAEPPALLTRPCSARGAPHAPAQGLGFAGRGEGIPLPAPLSVPRGWCAHRCVYAGVRSVRVSAHLSVPGAGQLSVGRVRAPVSPLPPNHLGEVVSPRPQTRKPRRRDRKVLPAVMLSEG